MIHFRKEALEKNRSSEHFDELLRVSKPSHWILTGSIVLVIISVLIWSFIGEMSIKVKGSGIILNTSGLSEVKTRFEGVLTNINIEVGDHVNQGQVLASVSQPKLESDIRNLEEELKLLHEKYNFLLVNNDFSKRNSSIAKLKSILDTTKRSFSERIMLDSVWVNVADLRDRLFELQNFGLNSIAKVHDRIEMVTGDLKSKKDAYSIECQIFSPFDGVVVELSMSSGDVFSSSTSFCTIENDGIEKNELIGLIYVNASEGKKIHPGMRVLLSPSTISPEESGYLEGYVYYVSKYPATQSGMNRVIRNEKIVEQLSENGIPLAVEVRIQWKRK